MRRPRHPAASISFQALWPGGFLKVEPPVRSLIGWLASRYSATSFISLRIAAGSPALPWYRASVKIQSAGTPQWRYVMFMSESGRTMQVALAIDRLRLDQRILGLAPVRAGVHAQRAADRAGNAAVEGKPGDAGIGGGARELGVGNGRAGANAVARLHGDLREAAPQPDGDAGHAAVAHQQVGAEADHGDGRSAGRLARK